MNSNQFKNSINSLQNVSLSKSEKEVMSETLKRYTQNHTIPGKGSFLTTFLSEIKNVFAVRLRF